MNGPRRIIILRVPIRIVTKSFHLTSILRSFLNIILQEYFRLTHPTGCSL